MDPRRSKTIPCCYNCFLASTSHLHTHSSFKLCKHRIGNGLMGLRDIHFLQGEQGQPYYWLSQKIEVLLLRHEVAKEWP
ncbi:hypothetical protein C4J93_3438 [Pseudomonas sp. R2-37-08W]|nr:hypothetical protein C4J93_3438 [Pseudomonas sp. R2-37-08W]